MSATATVTLTPTGGAIPSTLAPIIKGEPGPAGAASTVPGPAGPGVPTGGTTGQVLAKATNADHDTEWVAQTGGSGGGATNLAYTASPTGGTVTSDTGTGTDATLPLADATNAGLMAPAQHTKLAGIAAGATAVAVDATPTNGSTNAVSSDGVFDALAGKETSGAAAAAVAAHVAAGDPHPAYALESALGTASALNAPATGDATSGEVVKGSDTRLTDARTPTTHTHSASQISDSTAAGRAVLTAADAAAQRTALGLGAVATASDTDGVTEGGTNLYHTAARVRATLLTGISTAAGTIVAATHTVLEAIGFLQKQVSDNTTAISDSKVRSVTVLLPATNDEITLFRAKAAMTITKLVAVGGGFTYTVRKASDRSATGTEVVTGGSAVTSTTTGDAVTSFNSASIAAGDYVWLKLTSVTGTPASFNLTMEF